MEPSPAELAAALRDARHDLLDGAAQLSETRVFRATDRDGWTLKHELAYLAAADRVLLDLIEELRSVPGEAPIVIAPDEIALRRLCGRYMHQAQELRLSPLREQLETLGDQLPAAIEQYGPLLDRAAALGGAPQPAIEHARAHLDRAVEGVARVRAATG